MAKIAHHTRAGNSAFVKLRASTMKKEKEGFCYYIATVKTRIVFVLNHSLCKHFYFD
jgi:hypothetical protein